MNDSVVLTLTDLEYCGSDKVRCVFSDTSRPALKPVRIIVNLAENGGDLDRAIQFAGDAAVDRFQQALSDIEVEGLCKSKLVSGQSVFYKGKLSEYKKGGNNV